MSTPNLNNLREQVTALKALLDDPHPGLSTWRLMVAEHLKTISEFWVPHRVSVVKPTAEHDFRHTP